MMVDDVEDILLGIEQGKVDLIKLQELIISGSLLGETTSVRSTSSIRCRSWKLLLGVGSLEKKKYMDLVSKGENVRFGEKIRKDTSRTFASDVLFARDVPEAFLIRLLNAYTNQGDSFIYLQGMNVLCGILLYVMPELDAFYGFNRLMELLKNYTTANMDGVKRGCELTDECLRIVDKELSAYIEKSGSNSWVFAHQPMLTLCAGIPPLASVVQLWDYYLAAGIHLNVIFFVSYLIIHRDEIVKSNKKLCIINGRDYPAMDATKILEESKNVLSKLSPEFLRKLESHVE